MNSCSHRSGLASIAEMLLLVFFLFHYIFSVLIGDIGKAVTEESGGPAYLMDILCVERALN